MSEDNHTFGDFGAGGQSTLAGLARDDHDGDDRDDGDQEGPARCDARTSSGEQCQNPPAAGSDLCGVHGRLDDVERVEE